MDSHLGEMEKLPGTLYEQETPCTRYPVELQLKTSIWQTKMGFVSHRVHGQLSLKNPSRIGGKCCRTMCPQGKQQTSQKRLRHVSVLLPLWRHHRYRSDVAHPWLLLTLAWRNDKNPPIVGRIDTNSVSKSKNCAFDGNNMTALSGLHGEFRKRWVEVGFNIPCVCVVQFPCSRSLEFTQFSFQPNMTSKFLLFTKFYFFWQNRKEFHCQKLPKCHKNKVMSDFFFFLT